MNNDVLLGTTSCCEGTPEVTHSSVQDTGCDTGVQVMRAIGRLIVRMTRIFYNVRMEFLRRRKLALKYERHVEVYNRLGLVELEFAEQQWRHAGADPEQFFHILTEHTHLC